MRSYLLGLAKKLLITVVIAWGLGVLIMMTREVFSVDGALETLPSSTIFACFIFAGLTVLELGDLGLAAKNHEVPLIWVIRAKYELEWDEILYIYSDDFKEMFLEETGGEK